MVLSNLKIVQALCGIVLIGIVSCDNPPPKTSANGIGQQLKDSLIQNDTLVQNNKVEIKEENENALTDTLDKGKLLGDQGIYDRLPVLQFEKITEKIFNTYDKNYHSKLNTDLSKITLLDTTFTLRTSKAKLKFNRKFDDPEHWNRRDYCWTNYKGYIESLHLYVLEDWCQGEFTLGSLYLIDSLSNMGYGLLPESDSPFEVPVVSPGNRYFAAYVNNIVGANYFFIEIIKITNNDGVFSYKEFASAEVGNLEIVKLVWIDDKSFALKVNQQTYNESKKTLNDNFSYLKTNLPSSK